MQMFWLKLTRFGQLACYCDLFATILRVVYHGCSKAGLATFLESTCIMGKICILSFFHTLVQSTTSNFLIRSSSDTVAVYA